MMTRITTARWKASSGALLFIGVCTATAPVHASTPAPVPVCAAGGAVQAILPGQPTAVEPRSPRRLQLDLAEAEEVAITLTPASPDAQAVELCDEAGVALAMLPGQPPVAGTLTARFAAPTAGRFTLVVGPTAVARTITVRTPDAPAIVHDAVPIVFGANASARIVKNTPRTWAFTARAGQWARITANSTSDTALHLAGPAPGGGIAQLGDDDDSIGQDPLIQRKLPITGTYYIRVESLADEPDDALLQLREVPAPPPLPAPLAIAAGTTAAGRLANDAARVFYDLPVRAGRTYRATLSAPFAGALDIGLADPFEPAGTGPATGIAPRLSADIGETGVGRSGKTMLAFTAASAGHVLLQIRSLGIGETDGGYTLSIIESGG